MRQSVWSNLVKALPKNLTVSEVASIFRRSENLTRRRLLALNYSFRETKKYNPPAWAKNASWDMPNVDIAKKYGISRERVRIFRKRLGHPPVEARGRRINGQSKKD